MQLGSFQELTIVISIAGILAYLVQFLKQPTIIAYILTGLIVGPFGLLNLNNRETLELMGQIGITLLLFLVGMEMNFPELKKLGRASLLTGIGQILFTTFFGLILARLFNFPWLEAFYIAVALTFSSTIIVVKLLSEKKELSTLHGKITVGFLLVQDFVAIIFLIVLAGIGQSNGSNFNWIAFGFTLIKAFLLTAFIWSLGQSILPKIVSRLARSTELLFLFSIAWALFVAYIASSPWIGLSIEIGGFLAGLSLASSAQHFQIDARIRPLRDFFIVLFFVVLGSSLAFNGSAGLIWPAIGFSLFVLICNPLIVMTIMGLLGYRKRTSFLTSLATAQISEFSLILMALGLSLGQVTQNSVAIVTIVGVITIVFSSYLITYSQKLYELFEAKLNFFERKKVNERHEEAITLTQHIVLVGAHRLGQHIMVNFDPQNLVIVDYNPAIIEKLSKHYPYCYYGDIIDPSIQALTNIDDASLVISTIPDVNGNLRLIKALTDLSAEKNKKPKFICAAYGEWEAQELYLAGADYVLLPHFISGQQLSESLLGHGLENLAEWKARDLKTIAHYI